MVREQAYIGRKNCTAIKKKDLFRMSRFRKLALQFFNKHRQKLAGEYGNVERRLLYRKFITEKEKNYPSVCIGRFGKYKHLT